VQTAVSVPIVLVLGITCAFAPYLAVAFGILAVLAVAAAVMVRTASHPVTFVLLADGSTALTPYLLSECPGLGNPYSHIVDHWIECEQGFEAHD